MLCLVPALLEHAREGGRQLGVNNPAHVGSRSRSGGVLEARVNVRRLQTGEVLEDFIFRHAGGEHFEHVLHTDAHPADARAPAAFARFDGDTVEEWHAFRVAKFGRETRALAGIGNYAR